MLHKKAEIELESARLHLLRFDHQITALTQQKSFQIGQLEKLSLLRSKIENDLKKMREEVSSNEKELEEMFKKNSWIQDNQRYIYL